MLPPVTGQEFAWASNDVRYLTDEGAGATLNDKSGNGNDGTFGASAPTWVAKGLNFATS